MSAILRLGADPARHDLRDAAPANDGTNAQTTQSAKKAQTAQPAPLEQGTSPGHDGRRPALRMPPPAGAAIN